MLSFNGTTGNFPLG